LEFCWVRPFDAAAGTTPAAALRVLTAGEENGSTALAVQFLLPENFDDAIHTGFEVAAVGAEGQVEQFGSLFLRFSGLQVSAVQCLIEF
jgi:hypothetical protein